MLVLHLIIGIDDIFLSTFSLFLFFPAFISRRWRRGLLFPLFSRVLIHFGTDFMQYISQRVHFLLHAFFIIRFYRLSQFLNSGLNLLFLSSINFVCHIPQGLFGAVCKAVSLVFNFSLFLYLLVLICILLRLFDHAVNFVLV